MGAHGLSKDWATVPAFDLELKRYQLLGYLKRVKEQFGQHKLYPYLEELREHRAELLELRRRKEGMQWAMQGELIGFDPRTGAALHERRTDVTPLQVIDEVLDLAIPKLERTLTAGELLRQELSHQVDVVPIGVQPLDLRTGWLMLRTGHEVRVYGYDIPWIQGSVDQEGQRSVRTNYVSTFPIGLSWTYEHVRHELLRVNRQLPLAATFALECAVQLPTMETYLPLARQRIHDLFMAGTSAPA